MHYAEMKTAMPTTKTISCNLKTTNSGLKFMKLQNAMLTIP